VARRAPPRPPGTPGRPRKHGGELALADPATWPAPQVTTSTATSRYGMAPATGQRYSSRGDRQRATEGIVAAIGHPLGQP
jgi:hypothetical protein